MKKILLASIAAASVGFATPAYAEACTGTAGSLPYQTVPSYVDCEQVDAINGGNAAAVAAYNAGFDAVGYVGPDLTWASLEPTKDFFAIINGAEIIFDTALVGQQFFAVHFGSSGGEKGEYNDTLFYQFYFAAPTSSVDLSRQGYSNAIGVFSVPGIPEPATWAMMLLGFGAVGHTMRRRQRKGLGALQPA